MPLTAGLHLDVPHDEYHADPCPAPSLSHSIAHRLISRSPLHAWYQHPRLGGGERDEATAAMDSGQLIDSLLLGGGQEIVTINADDWRTKAAKEQRDEARAAGKLPVLLGKYNEARELAERVTAALKGHGVAFSGSSQVTAVWQSDDVWCRGRFDHWREADGLIYDVKFLESASPEGFARHMVNYGADIQRAAYVNAVETLRPELAGRVRFVFVVIESSPPHPIALYEAGGSMRELGARKWAQAKETWARCLAANDWPSYPPGPTSVEAPAWAIASQMSSEIQNMGVSDGISF